MWASPLRSKNRAAYASLGHSGHLAGVRDQDGTLSAISVERCPPSRRNAARHQPGTLSGIARNTQPRMRTVPYWHGSMSGFGAQSAVASSTSPDFAAAPPAVLTSFSRATPPKHLTQPHRFPRCICATAELFAKALGRNTTAKSVSALLLQTASPPGVTKPLVRASLHARSGPLSGLLSLAISFSCCAHPPTEA